MKLTSRNKILQFILLALITSNFQSISIGNTNYDQLELENTETTSDQTSNSSDAVHKRILEYISAIAEEKMKSSDLMLKKKIVGALPEGYPSETIRKAKESRKDKKKWRQILSLPTQIYRTCLYPYSKLNYVRWCNNNFFGAKKKGETCLYNFCEVCCDHLVLIYQNAAEKNIIGEMLQLNQEQGKKSLNAIINKTTVQKCKAECKNNYPVEMPVTQEKPPRDPQLGTNKKPAMTCTDIKQWGPKTAKSGIYWIELPAKGPQKVFCDMETDGGGWTLFFNYVHHPGQELFLDENKLPADLKTYSHMYLKNAGFIARDATELRFLCSERFKAEKKFWHFKTTNRDVISVAMTGDQSSLKPNSLAGGYVELKPPSALIGKYAPAVQQNQIGQFNIAGKNPKGGFTSTTFGSSNFEAYWTVKGELPNKESFECGSSHKFTGFTSNENSPSMVFTHHSIWFRGNPPSDDEARARFIKNINKKN